MVGILSVKLGNLKGGSVETSTKNTHHSVTYYGIYCL